MTIDTDPRFRRPYKARKIKAGGLLYNPTFELSLDDDPIITLTVPADIMEGLVGLMNGAYTMGACDYSVLCRMEQYEQEGTIDLDFVKMEQQ